MRSWRRGKLLAVLAVGCFVAGTQARQQKPIAKKAAAQKVNELTLAGLRPGRDSTNRAMELFRRIDPKSATHDSQTIWSDACRKQLLAIDFDTEKRIQVVRAIAAPSLTSDCAAPPPSPWKTGHGLRVGDSATKVVQLYGQPDSRSPSTKDGQPLELMYYAFDWAGPDVPQVLEVLCTREKEGQPGRVVEITLAAPSL